MGMPRSSVPRESLQEGFGCSALPGAWAAVVAVMGLTGGMSVPGVLGLADAQAVDQSPVPDDRFMSAGNWDVVAVEWDGSPVDQETLSRLQVVFQADGSWAVFLGRIPVAEGTSTNRQDDSPKTFEMQTLGSEGIDPSRYTGIYRLDGDIRVFCLVPAGKPRPEDFSAPRHSDRMLVTLKRAQKPGRNR